ncbi:hypothetical protein JCM33374_g4389 [Metschnikowia sp. JCM 33374]|nr:hypothetical protein JCM33374_g4389 [Metschnikowia sp. JCM 33374]
MFYDRSLLTQGDQSFPDQTISSNYIDENVPPPETAISLGDHMTLAYPTGSVRIGVSTFAANTNEFEVVSEQPLLQEAYPKCETDRMHSFDAEMNTDPHSKLEHSNPKCTGACDRSLKKPHLKTGKSQVRYLTPLTQQIFKPPPEAKTNKISECPPNITRINDFYSSTNARQKAEEAFVALAPSLKKVDGNNFCSFLVEFLGPHHQYLSLDLLFNLLYNESGEELETVLNSEFIDTENFENKEQTLIAIHLFHMVLKSLQTTQISSGSSATSRSNTSLAAINLHELSRCCLAFQIIFASVKEPEKPDSRKSGISRNSFYKVYFIICQLLSQRCSNMSQYTAESIILSQSNLGKLTKLARPNGAIKRLGKRGQSKYHYMGLAWDTSIVTPDILQLVELDMVHLKEYFSKFGATSSKKSRNKLAKVSWFIPTKGPKQADKNSLLPALQTFVKPSYTFVDISHRYPASDCSPRVWEITPNCIPQQSKWAKDNTERSLVVLRDYGVELTPLITNFNAGCFSRDNPDSLPKSVFQAMLKLQAASASREIYLHLYFIIMVMILPVVIASDTEVGTTSKHHFRQAVNTCVGILESEKSHICPTDGASLGAFLGILTKMAQLNEMTSCKVDAPYAASILDGMASGLHLAVTAEPNDSIHQSPIETMYIRSMITSMNAYNFTFVDETDIDQTGVEGIVSSLAGILKDTAKKSKEEMSMLSQCSGNQAITQVGQDVPHQVLHISLKNFHQVTLNKPLFLRLPVVIFISIINEFSNWMQAASLNDFKKGDAEFARECFKCCWVFSSMYHEYMKIHSEVIALSQTLTQAPADLID